MVTFTHPGKFGDLLWALPTVRALGGGLLWLPEALRPMEPLLRAQPYIQQVYFDASWQVQDTAPATPRVPPDYFDRSVAWNTGGAYPGPFYHLGYRDWPDRPLPEYVAHEAGVAVDLSQPWIVPPVTRRLTRSDVLVSFTDRWFELKLGLLYLLAGALDASARILLTYQPQSRWDTILAPAGVQEIYSWWEDLPWLVANARLVLTDNSAIMVLCAGLQTTPCLVVEPEEARHHAIFWPGVAHRPTGHDHWYPREPLCRWIHPLLGSDGRPTFDGRHLVDRVRELLEVDRG